MNAAHLPTLTPLLPEFVLGIGAIVLLLIGVFRGEGSSRFVDVAAMVLLVAAGAILLWLPPGKLTTFNGSFVVDDFARFLKILALIGSIAAIAMSLDYERREREQRSGRARQVREAISAR